MNDPRLTLIRNGVAAFALQGTASAMRYQATTAARCIVTAAAIRAGADAMAQQQDQLIFGEAFDILTEEGAFVFGQARRDGYVGFVERAALADGLVEPTHWVSALRTFAFAKPDVKAAAVGAYTVNSLIVVERTQDPFSLISDGGWVPSLHLTPIGQYLDDWMEVALRFLGAPYLWGGRASAGLDCSGLIQQALYACGRSCPRDTDMQASALGHAIKPAALARGDLVFWDGHAGMMLDKTQLLHANAHHMATAIEPLTDVIARVGQPTGYRRL